MEHITDVAGLQFHNTAVALGKFDGFHRGHQLLLNQVRAWQEQGLTGVIFTFAEVGMGFGVQKRIDSHEEKRRKAEAAGIDVLLEYPFTKEFSAMEPETFVADILIGQLGVRAVAVGKDFRFGRNRSGDTALLADLGQQYGFEVMVFDKLKENQQEISSSLIRSEIEAGHMEQAAVYMGQGYRVFAEVIHGKELGTAIGIPTANQRIPMEKLLPPFGVYMAKIRWENQIFYGISNLGYKPTVSEEQSIGLETYIFDFDRNIYGVWIEVELLRFIRPEKKFAGVEELVSQMKEDIAQVKEWKIAGFEDVSKI